MMSLMLSMSFIYKRFFHSMLIIDKIVNNFLYTITQDTTYGKPGKLFLKSHCCLLWEKRALVISPFVHNSS